MNKSKKEQMDIAKIYDIAIKKGIENDFRSKADINELFRREKERYRKLEGEDKNSYDKDRLINPFSDTRVLNISENKNIKKILSGIDIGSGEILYAQMHNDIDLVISHHPLGKALSNLSDVMHLQADVLNMYGVPINIAESLLKERISEVSRGVNPINHNKEVDLARLFKINLMCVHTPADNFAAKFLDESIKKAKIAYVGDLLKLLRTIPEYKESIKIGAGPKLFAGFEDSRVGKIALTEITGGTEGSAGMYEKMAQAGIGTIVAMHLSEERKKEAEKAHINVVVAGHISSDSLGMNLFLDELEKKGIEIVPCSGLTRIKRFK
ncbi:MAG: Nif3-like dinuclear metal center hexameric protein [Candidatus Paceibacterota bacterium]|jgi:putative NIF3 family GTP cyclohydrolase 1 type 2